MALHLFYFSLSDDSVLYTPSRCQRVYSTMTLLCPSILWLTQVAHEYLELEFSYLYISTHSESLNTWFIFHWVLIEYLSLCPSKSRTASALAGLPGPIPPSQTPDFVPFPSHLCDIATVAFYSVQYWTPSSLINVPIDHTSTLHLFHQSPNTIYLLFLPSESALQFYNPWYPCRPRTTCVGHLILPHLISSCPISSCPHPCLILI